MSAIIDLIRVWCCCGSTKSESERTKEKEERRERKRVGKEEKIRKLAMVKSEGPKEQSPQSSPDSSPTETGLTGLMINSNSRIFDATEGTEIPIPSIYDRESLTPSKIPDDAMTKEYHLDPEGPFVTEEDVLRKNNYKLGPLLGRGGFGIVYKVFKDDGTGKPKETYACKLIDLKKKRKKKKMLRVIKTELFVFETIKHNNIILLHEHFIIDSTLYIIMEYATNGSMFELVNQKGPLSDIYAKKYFGQTLSAVRHMHYKGIAHRDIKLENILLTKDSAGDIIVKVTDFGLSQVAFKPDTGIVKSKHYAGTRAYMAPEIIRLAKQDNDKSKQRIPFNPLIADIWSLGVVLYAMLTGGLYPFDASEPRNMLILQQKRIFKVPKQMNPDAVNLLKQIFHPNIHMRITLFGVMSHQWLRGETSISLN